MLSPRRPLTDEIKKQILEEKENGSSVYAIAKKISRSPSTVRCFLKCYGNDHQLSRKRGRKPKLTDEIEDFIAQFSDNKDISCSKIATEIKKKFPDVSLSKETVRVIRQRLNKQQVGEIENILTPTSSNSRRTPRDYGEFENGIFWGKQQRDEEDRKEFAAKIFALNRPIILSNSYTIQLSENGILTRCNMGEQPVMTAFTAIGKSTEITIWAAIGNGWKSQLFVLKDNVHLVDLLRINNVSDELIEKFGVHVFLDEKMLKSEIFPFVEYFPNDCSDLNTINDLFMRMQNEVKQRQFRNEDELISYLTYLWSLVTFDDIHYCLQSFYDKLKHCMD